MTVNADLEASLAVQLGRLADLQGGVAAQLGRLADSYDRAEQWRVRCLGALQQVPIASQVITGNGTIDTPDQMQAKTGYCWSVRRLVALGFTAGTVTIYRNIVGGEILAAVTAAGVPQFYDRGTFLLMPDDRMIAVSAGITGTVQLIGSADCFERWYLPVYIGAS